MPDPNRPSGLSSLSDGIRTGLGILSAFKEAVEETLQDAVDRGDLSPERAKQAMQGAADRLQAGIEDARDRFDVVTRHEFDTLQAEVTELRERLARVEGRAPPAATPTETTTPAGIIVTE